MALLVNGRSGTLDLGMTRRRIGTRPRRGKEGRMTLSDRLVTLPRVTRGRVTIDVYEL